MKSLLKVICRYMGTAVLIIILIIAMNFGVFLYFTYQTVAEEQKTADMNSRGYLDMIGEELNQDGEKYSLSAKGYDILLQTDYVWAMLVDESGKSVWEWQVPKEIPRTYTMADVSILSKWYIKDYPVKTWKHGDGFIIFANEIDSIVRFNFKVSYNYLQEAPRIFLYCMIANLVLIIGTVSFLAYRFYRSLKPVAYGIESLSRKENIVIPEKGVTEELAHKFNQTSRILEEQNERLSQRDHARTNWIAGVSHDIRTPLSLITGYSGSLSQDGELNQEQRNKASMIQNQSMTIKKLIEDLNLTSKLEYDAQPLRMEEFTPASFIREIVTEYYNNGLEDKYEIYLSVHQDVESATAEGDVGLLNRCFCNIIGNSIRHNQSGCFINITVCMKEERLEYLFQDSGPGIPSQVVEALESQSADQEKAPHIMGLRVVRQIVLAHKGQLKFMKRPLEGYDMQVQFPLKRLKIEKDTGVLRVNEH